MAWVTLYCGTAGGAVVARQVTESLASGGAATAHAVAWGVAIHMSLSVLVALAYGLLVWRPITRHLGQAAEVVSSCSALVALWVLSFFVVLPAINPGFVELMPYSVTLASKLMFGMAMAAGLAWGRARPVRTGRLGRASAA